MTTHHCHCIGCQVECPAILLCCWHHWGLVPDTLKRALWLAYVPGQEIRKDPTPAYLQAAARCLIAVAEQEGREVPPIYQAMAAGR